MNIKHKKNIINQERIINYSNKEFYSICKSSKKIKHLKNIINKDKKIIVFKKVINNKALKEIKKVKNNILNRKPMFFKTFLGSKDLFIFNKLNKKSTVKGYFKKIELYPWNEKNRIIYSNLKKVMELKCTMDSLNFNGSKNQSFFDNRKFLKIQLTNYPPKKGFLKKHIDGIYKSIIVLQIGMASSGKYNNSSGLTFYFNNEEINVDQHIKAGDIAIYNPIIPHAVNPSKSGKGRWSMLISSGYFGKLKGTRLQSKQVDL